MTTALRDQVPAIRLKHAQHFADLHSASIAAPVELTLAIMASTSGFEDTLWPSVISVGLAGLAASPVSCAMLSRGQSA